MLITFLAFQVNLKSCDPSKNARQSSSIQIQGLWTGTFTAEQGAKGVFYFSIKPNGDILIENNYKGVLRVANGKWNIVGNTFTCSGTYFYGSPENIGTVTEHTAYFDNKENLMSGVWKNIYPNNDTGTFTMTKIQ